MVIGSNPIVATKKMRGTSPRASPITVLKLGSEIPCQSRTREKIFLLLYINSVKNGEIKKNI